MKTRKYEYGRIDIPARKPEEAGVPENKLQRGSALPLPRSGGRPFNFVFIGYAKSSRKKEA